MRRRTRRSSSAPMREMSLMVDEVAPGQPYLSAKEVEVPGGEAA